MTDDKNLIFDDLYNNEDPWNTGRSIVELCRAKKYILELGHCEFFNGLDIGCGEGTITSTFNFVHNMTGIDISEKAINRAQYKYPNIKFYQGDILDLRTYTRESFDFISCLETIYYIKDEEKKERAIKDIIDLGQDNCIYLFSVVTIGENKYGKYFTYKQALDLFSKYFNVVNTFPVSLKINLIVRVLLKINKKISERILLYFMKGKNIKYAYQTAYLCVKKCVKK